MAPAGYANTSDATTTWKYWCDTSTATASTTIDTWAYWNQGYITNSSAYYMTATTTATSDTVWAYWNGSNWSYDRQQARPNAMTAEETAAHLRQQQELRERQAAAAAEATRLTAEIEARAEALLKANLDAQQAAEFEKERAFTVISKDGQRRYRVRKGWQHNVERIDAAGKKLHTLCAHPTDSVPHYDNMLAQKLLLEHAEDEFLKMANVGRG